MAKVTLSTSSQSWQPSAYARAAASETAFTPTITPQNAQTLPGTGPLTATTQATINAATSGVINAAAPWRYTASDIVAIAGAGRVSALSQTQTGGRVSDTQFPFRVEFDFDGQVLALNVLTTVNTKFRVWANEQVSAEQNGYTGSVSQYVLVDFGSAAYRRVSIEFAFGTYFYGLLYPKTNTILPPSSRCPYKFAEVGDSYTAGQGADANSVSYLGYHHRLARLLGFTDHRMYGEGGTGFLKTNGSYLTYRQRIADVTGYAPDFLLLRGTVNDRTFVGAGTIGPEVTAYVNAVLAALPSCKIVMTGPLDVQPAANQSADAALSAEYKTAAAALNIPFIDPVPSATAGAPNWYYGSGSVSAPTGDGNADLYSSSFAGGHPSVAGHAFTARALAGPIAAAWKLGL